MTSRERQVVVVYSSDDLAAGGEEPRGMNLLFGEKHRRSRKHDSNSETEWSGMHRGRLPRPLIRRRGRSGWTVAGDSIADANGPTNFPDCSPPIVRRRYLDPRDKRELDRDDGSRSDARKSPVAMRLRRTAEIEFSLSLSLSLSARLVLR